MYGMLLESIHLYVQTHYGDDCWSRVVQRTGLRDPVFSVYLQYADALVTGLAESCSAVTGDATRDGFMRRFGEYFVDYFTRYGYGLVMRASGRHYRDFLNEIDNLHEAMRFHYPRMSSPSFYVCSEDRSGCLLHYKSRRVGFTQYVVGQLVRCADSFYGIVVDVAVVEENVGAEGCHVVFRLDFDNAAFAPLELSRQNSSLAGAYGHIGHTTFFKLFSGGGKTIIGQKLDDCFSLRRPLIDPTWDNIWYLQKVTFEMESVIPVRWKRCCDAVYSTTTTTTTTMTTTMNRQEQEEHHDDDDEVPTQRILLKGQMKYNGQLDAMAFLCSPLLSNLSEMQMLGLYIHDLSMHDSSRDMVMAGWQHASRLESSIEKQLVKSCQIRKAVGELDQLRQKSEELLYSMIPRQVADRLKNGEESVNTWESFDQVTIMFSFLIGFTELCSVLSPHQLQRCINSVFSVFDRAIDEYDVFKVETVGDAVYMVAGGVPDRKEDHAVSVAGVALKFLDHVRLIELPTDGKTEQHPLHVRIGMHTGGVVAGVIGKKMPQYCLFGDTVNTASRMQTLSQAGRICISEMCNENLRQREFETVLRGELNVKGKGLMNTYWLVGKAASLKVEAERQVQLDPR